MKLASAIIAWLLLLIIAGAVCGILLLCGASVVFASGVWLGAAMMTTASLLLFLPSFLRGEK